ncbi:hypothetical protein ACQ4M3_37315 [Leptolyngbya sp. AN03gr2]|uniref:hypothetical protein n=1 Tax=unclassified Leptolyngbya TaxID=2650499 RepID=UPI003D31F260
MSEQGVIRLKTKRSTDSIIHQFVWNATLNDWVSLIKKLNEHPKVTFNAKDQNYCIGNWKLEFVFEAKAKRQKVDEIWLDLQYLLHELEG